MEGVGLMVEFQSCRPKWHKKKSTKSYKAKTEEEGALVDKKTKRVRGSSIAGATTTSFRCGRQSMEQNNAIHAIIGPYIKIQSF